MYPPLNSLKPVASDIWIVDSGPLRLGGLSLPIRMTVVSLKSGKLWLHSPTDMTASIRAEIDRLGQVGHIIAPNTAHWMRVKAWQQSYPDAVTWAAPHLASRGQVKRSGAAFSRELGGSTEAEWSGDLDQAVVPGGANYREVLFYHHASSTLILTDLIVNLEPGKLSAFGRLGARLTGTLAPNGTAPVYMRQVLRMRRAEASAAVSRMLAHHPERAIFSHGAWYENNATQRLRKSLDWLLG